MSKQLGMEVQIAMARTVLRDHVSGSWVEVVVVTVVWSQHFT